MQRSSIQQKGGLNSNESSTYERAGKAEGGSKREGGKWWHRVERARRREGDRDTEAGLKRVEMGKVRVAKRKYGENKEVAS